jgi:16S rRNA (cytosine967-C5)-methyltransferase
VLEQLLERPLPASARPVHGLLLVGLAQLEVLDIPAHAAIGATAEAARDLRQPRLVGLVNAVLRRWQRERETLLERLDGDEVFVHAHPQWLLDALQAAWPGQWQAIVEANNREAPPWLRVNRRRTDRDAYLERLHAIGLETRIDARLPDAVQLSRSLAPHTLPGWDEGLVSIQDGAAQFVVEALDPRPGQRVLDACAAPGGKAAALLEAADIDLLALDRDAQRLHRVEQTLQRLGLVADVRCADAATVADWWDGRPFDRILIDAPCSATGVIRRQPDIRWHRRAGDIGALAATQARLLDALWPLLGAGGRLVYATCSVLPDENAGQIDAFLVRHPDARVRDPGPGFGRAAGVGRQRLPGEDGMDGFFHAIIERAEA